MSVVGEPAVRVTAELEVEVPMVPNYLRRPGAAGVEVPIDIAELSEKELRRIAAVWAERLVAHAEYRRKRPPNVRAKLR